MSNTPNLPFMFSQCLRHAFMTGAGYGALAKISEADQKRWVDYRPSDASFNEISAALQSAAESPPPTGHSIEFRISINGSDGCQAVLSHWPEGYALERHGEIVWREEIQPEPREDRL